MIGNRGYATFIRDWVRQQQNLFGKFGTPRIAPEGWTRLGEGCYRIAYLSPDGVVYKVQLSGGYSYQTNEGEYRKYNNLRIAYRMPKGARFPLMCNFRIEGEDTVNAMDMVGPTLNKYEGEDRHKLIATWSSLAWTMQLGDAHHANVAVDEARKLVVPIDLGD